MQLPFFLAKRFVAGEDFDTAAPKVIQLNEKSIKVTLDLLGENIGKRSEAEQNLKNYQELLAQIEENNLQSSISVKLSMIGLNISKSFCRDNLFALLNTAQELNQFVRIDMEGSDITQVTLDIFKEAHQTYGNHVGIVIQAYLYRSQKDIDELVEMKADVRLCKGAYNEPTQIALQNMTDIREAFKRYAALLIEKSPFPRIATHDDELINWVKKYTADHNISKDRFEFQMLYGLRLKTCEQLAEQGYHVRIYVPYGTQWLPYFTRRLKERKENIWFLSRTIFKN